MSVDLFGEPIAVGERRPAAFFDARGRYFPRQTDGGYTKRGPSGTQVFGCASLELDDAGATCADCKLLVRKKNGGLVPQVRRDAEHHQRPRL